MKKSILQIVFILFVLLFCLFCMLFYSIKSGVSEFSNEVRKFNSQTTDVYITNSDKILVKQTIDVKNCIPKNKNNFQMEQYSFYIPICTTSNDSLSFRDITNIKSNISVFIDSIKDNSNHFVGIKVDENQMNLLMNELEQNDYKVIFSYEINSREVLSYIDNNEHIILNLKGNRKFANNNDLYIHLPNDAQVLNNDTFVKKQDENTYSINLKRENIEYRIKLDGNFTQYVSAESNYVYGANVIIQKSLYLFVPITLIFTIILVLAYIQKRVKIEKGEYERNPENVIDPILAESIIDGKIDAKDLIMTCLVNLIYKKKLENIDNDCIKLVDISNLSKIEEKVIMILFSLQNNIDDRVLGRTIKISNIEDIFKQENKTTLNIYEKFIKVKKAIKKQLIELNILNPIWDVLLNQLRILSLMLVFNMINILVLGSIIFSSVVYQTFLIIGNVSIYVLLNRNNPRAIINMKPSREQRGTIAIILVVYIGIVIMEIYFNLIDTELLLSYVILIIINFLIFRFSKTYVFTNKGKQEYIKAVMLKRYLIDYSLIEQRDIDSVVIFDEYLVYATAFGIPSKITNKISEALMNSNIKLQILSKILTL